MYNNTNAMSFDGIDDYVDTGNSFQSTLSDSFTIEFWAKVADASASNRQELMSSVNPIGIGDIIEILWNKGKLSFYYFTGGNQADTQTGIVLVNENWHHIVCVADSNIKAAGGLKIYFDSKYVSDDGNTSAVDFADWDSEENFYIGAFKWLAGGSSDHFNGLIDNVSIYNYALSAAQIQQHYAKGAARRGIAVE